MALDAYSARRLLGAYIRADPLTVTVERTERVPDGAGGRRAFRSALGPYVVRAVAAAGAVRQDSEAGLRQEDDWIVYAPAEADLRHGANVTDVLHSDDPPMRLRVQTVKPLRIGGVTWGLRATCVRET